MALTFLSAHALASLCTMEPAPISATRAEQSHQAAGGWVPSSAPAGPRRDPSVGRGPRRVKTHRVDVKEETVLVLAGVQTFHSVQQAWVGVVEVRMGNEHRCIWMRTQTP